MFRLKAIMAFLEPPGLPDCSDDLARLITGEVNRKGVPALIESVLMTAVEEPVDAQTESRSPKRH